MRNKGTELKKFDDVLSSDFNGREIVYGVMYAAEPGGTVLLIKKGQDKDGEQDEDVEKRVRGYGDRYLKMADYYRNKRNVTVFVASNPFDGFDSVCDAVGVIGEYYRRHGIPEDEQRILYFGHSYGALAGAMYAHNYPQITDMILVNMPPRLSFWEQFTEGMESFMRRGELFFVYGENDPLFWSGKLLVGDEVEGLNFIPAEGADHNFTEQTEAFIRIPELFWEHHKSER